MTINDIEKKKQNSMMSLKTFTKREVANNCT
jgi:hypothetical protein